MGPITRIAVHVDGGARDAAVLRLAINLAARFGAELEAVFAKIPPFIPASVDGILTPQIVEAQHGAAPRPLRFDLREVHRPPRAFAQPRCDPIGMAFGQGQHLRRHAQQQRGDDEHDHTAVSLQGSPLVGDRRRLRHTPSPPRVGYR